MAVKSNLRRGRPAKSWTSTSVANESSRAYLFGQIAVALDLAGGNSHREARRVLDNLKPQLASADNEMVARYFHSLAWACYKARSIDESFDAFERSMTAAAATGNVAVIRVTLENYGIVLVQDGNVNRGIELLEEALESMSGRTRSVALVNLAEGLFTAGDLRGAATILRKFHDLSRSNPSPELLMNAAATGIPLGIMLADKALLRVSCDPALLELAFLRQDRQYFAQIAEAFCLLYEHQGRRADHDALLERTVDSLWSLDSSLALALRVARLGSAAQVPRVQALMVRHCAGNSAPSRAYRALFDSFIASRHRMARRAKKLALQAVRELTGTGRHTLEAIALDAAGLHAAAQELRGRCGASPAAVPPTWTGSLLPRGMATHLTPREQEIAQLAARGSTNRSIATTLGLSERTVHCHCRAIFAKLGIRSRWQLSRLNY